jgi:hypothetical protein
MVCACRRRSDRAAVGGDVEVGHQLLEVRVVVLEVVVGPGVDVDVHRLGMADDRQVEVLAAEHLFQPLRPFEVLDLGLDADLAQLRR